jgi:hypothetical protein
MRFDRERIIQLCNYILEAKLLMGIHLNDNGISLDNDFMSEILDIFAIGINDIP